MSDWQPIDTAEMREGNRILAYIPGLKNASSWAEIAVLECEELGTELVWYFAHDTEQISYDMCEPTHWMPLPEPPDE